MNNKTTWARIYYTVGALCGAFYRLAKSIHATDKQYTEFGKWMKKIEKEKKEEK